MIELLIFLVLSFIVLALLGIVIAFSPTLFVTEIAVLTRSKEPFYHTLFLILGIASSVTMISLLALLCIDPRAEIVLPSSNELLSMIPLTDILIGILLLFTGLRLLRPPGEHTKSTKTYSQYVASPKTLFWFGFIKMSTSLSSLAAIIFASRFIKTYYSFNTAQFAAVLWLVAISLLPFILLIVAKQYRPQIFSKIQHSSDRATTFNWRRIIAGVVLLASIWFMVIGIKNL